MDSMPGEDPTLPLGVNGSITFSRLPDVSGDEIHNQMGGGGVLPDVAEVTISPTKARTMKDFENQITELRKENFNLKLRIYFLEDRMQQECNGPNEDIYRINIELKVEVESLKRSLQEREQLLRKASKAVESLTQGGDAEIQHLKVEAEKKIQDMEQSLTGRIKILEENLKTVQEAAEEAFASTERERVRRVNAEQQLSLIAAAHPKEADVLVALEEKDRCIQQLTLSLESKKIAIQCLEEAASQGRTSGKCRLLEDVQDQPAALMHEEKDLEILRLEFNREKNDLEERVQCLQEELHERETELAVEKKNALKRDKTIQGLTLALKTKENENEELSLEMEGLNSLLAKARESIHKAQMQKLKGTEDSQVILMEKENLLADLRSENLTKDTENRKLQRKVKRVEQELADLCLEKEKLVKDLEEALLQKNKSDKNVNDLRNQLEKTQNEMVEKEKALEEHYSILLSEGDKKLQSQEQTIAHLTDDIAEKDELLQTLNRVIKEKDTALQGWSTKFQSLVEDKEALQKQNEILVEEKRVAGAEQQKTKDTEYAAVLEALQKERDVFSMLNKSLQDPEGVNNLQEELNTIFLLRKQLEEGIGENCRLRKALEDEILANRREEETFLSWSNQTSYMSICLRDPDLWDGQVDQLSLEELRKKYMELLTVVKEMRWVIQELKKKQFDGSSLDPSGDEKQKLSDTSELERTEESRTLTGTFEDEASSPSCDGAEMVGEIIPLDSPAHQPKPLNLPAFEPELVVDQLVGGIPATDKWDAPKKSSLTSLSAENGVAEFGPRQEQMKMANKPLDYWNTTERDSLKDDLEHKDEEELKQMIVQLRAELRCLTRASPSAKGQIESQAALSGPGGLGSEATRGLEAGIEGSKVELKDMATQTAAVTGNVGRLKCEGGRAADDATTPAARSSRLGQEPRQRRASPKSEPREFPLPITKANKSDLSYQPKRSRLPVLLKPSRSLGSVSITTSLPRPDLQLQHRPFPADGGLSGGPRPLSEDSQRHERAKDGLDPMEGGGEEKGPDMEKHTSELKPSPSEELTPTSDLEKLDGDIPAIYFDNKSLFSFKLSATSLDAFDSQTINVEELRQRIKDLKSEVAKYQMLLVQFDPLDQRPPNILFSNIQDDEALPKDGLFPPTIGESGQGFPVYTCLSQGKARREHLEDPAAPISEPPDGETVRRFKALLSENEAELEKEQIANMRLLDEVYRLQSKLKGRSQSEQDFVVGPLAHRRPCQRQQIHESHSICATYRQHLSSLIRAFEELLQTSEVDYYVAESFRKQLNQSAQLFERLEHQCLYGESVDDEMIKLCNLAQSLTELEITQPASSLEGVALRKEVEAGMVKTAETPTKFPPELLMEHLQEIRLLRHRLEESIKTNDCLRKQLEQQVSDALLEPDAASAGVPGSEQQHPLSSEIHFLRKQNQTLNVMLANGSQEKQKENEALRESLAQKHLAAECLQKDCDRLTVENVKLQEQVGRREAENDGLTREIYIVRNELNRLRMELTAKEHQLSEGDKLLHSLRVELKVHEKLDEAIQKARDPSRDGSDECWKDQKQPLDLHELLAEIQNLRVQLEQSVEANKRLHAKMEEQLSREKAGKSSSGSTVHIRYLFGQELQCQQGINDDSVLDVPRKCGGVLAPFRAELGFSTLDSSSHCSTLAPKSRENCPIPSHCVWADKNGQHILGLIEDYNSLRKHITEGRKQLSELKEADVLDSVGTAPPGGQSATIRSVQQNLEEAARLMDLLWRVSLPMKVVHAAAYSLQDESLKSELHSLRRKLSEQERKLQSATRHLHSATQLKENMERVIIDQLALTHNVLKKARGNLEIQPAENKSCPSSLSKKRV